MSDGPPPRFPQAVTPSGFARPPPSRFAPGTTSSLTREPGANRRSRSPVGGVQGGPSRRRSSASPSRIPALPPWSEYWDERKEVEVEGRGTFRVYTAGTKGPVLLCLHGGGYTGLTWSLLAARVKDSVRVVAPDLRGHGGTVTTDDNDLSSATLADDVVALWRTMFGAGSSGGGGGDGSSSGGGGGGSDGGGRGSSSGGGGGGADAGAADGGQGSEGQAEKKEGRAEEGAGVESQPPAVVLAGHSMGGALAVRVAALKAIPSLAGLVVIDVVEGTAITSLHHMRAVLDSRPDRFPSKEAAVQWAVQTGMCHSLDAACISVPSMLQHRSQQPASKSTDSLRKEVLTGISEEEEEEQEVLTGISEEEEEQGGGEGGGGGSAAACGGVASAAGGVASAAGGGGAGEIAAGVGERGGGGGELSSGAAGAGGGFASAEGGTNAKGNDPGGCGRGGGGDSGVDSGGGTGGMVGGGDSGGGLGFWSWRTPLHQSEAHWRGWFQGLSALFLSVQVPKVLVLAGTDRLDRELTIGQMQGKFQLVLLPQAGHAVHEDEAGRTAEAIQQFIQRFRVGQPPRAVPMTSGAPRVLPIPAGPAAAAATDQYRP